MLLLRVRVDMGAMAMKGYYAFPKAHALLEPHHQIGKYHIQDTRLGVGSYYSAEVQKLCLKQHVDINKSDTIFSFFYHIIIFSFLFFLVCLNVCLDNYLTQ